MAQLLLSSVFVLMFALFIDQVIRKGKKELKNEVSPQFLSKADKVLVDLEKVEIKSNSWQEEIILNSDSAKIDQLAGDYERSAETIVQHVNTLIFNIPYRGRMLSFHETIRMERKTLEMKLLLKKEATLYVNPENSDEYYLDLSFLK